MHFKPHIELPTTDGPAYFDPQRVVMILRSGAGAQIVLASNEQVHVTCSTEQAANKLWRFINAANDGAYFNAEHVIALVPNGNGCRLLFSQGGQLPMDAPAAVIIDGLRTANAQRNALAGQP